jgi:hypothetical protein
VPEGKDYKVTDRRAGGADGLPREPTPPAGAEGAGPLPEMDFATFVLSMASSAVAHLHGLDEEGNQTLAVDLPLARQAIDILAMLQQKTKGNLTGEEERLLDHVVYDLRLQYVAATKK